MNGRLFGAVERPGPAREHPVLAWLGFAALLSLWMLAVDGFDLVEAVRFQASRRDADDPLVRAAVVGVAWGAGALALALVCTHERAWLRRCAWGWVLLSTGTALAYRGLNQVGFTLHEAILMWIEAGYAVDTIVFFFSRSFLWVATAVGVAGGLAFVAARWAPRVRPLWLCLSVLLAFAIGREAMNVSDGKMHQLPSPFRVPLLILEARDHLVPWYGPRSVPELAPAATPAAPHIIFIMDESVSGDLLEINGGPKGTTPFLAKLAASSPGFFNFGVASSISNLSSTTNIVVQSGLQSDELPDTELRSLKAANVFAYMQAAGLSAHYVDAQTYGKPSNYMTGFDVDALDGFHQVIRLETGALEYEIDMRIVDRLAQLVEDHDRSFSYVLKSGAHIHYEGQYPESERTFSPTLSDGELTMMDFRGADRTRTVNSYLNTLRWTVDEFWRRLLLRLEATGREVVVIYTSDHGQSLLEPDPRDGEPELLSHNTPIDPPSFQAMVPLFAVAVGEEARGWLAARFDSSLVDRVDQFAIFPTLLVTAGYARDEVRHRYGPDLFSPEAVRSPRHFVSGDHLGRGHFHWNVYAPSARPLPEDLGDARSQR